MKQTQILLLIIATLCILVVVYATYTKTKEGFAAPKYEIGLIPASPPPPPPTEPTAVGVPVFSPSEDEIKSAGSEFREEKAAEEAKAAAEKARIEKEAKEKAEREAAERERIAAEARTLAEAKAKAEAEAKAKMELELARRGTWYYNFLTTPVFQRAPIVPTTAITIRDDDTAWITPNDWYQPFDYQDNVVRNNNINAWGATTRKRLDAKGNPTVSWDGIGHLMYTNNLEMQPFQHVGDRVPATNVTGRSGRVVYVLSFSGDLHSLYMQGTAPGGLPLQVKGYNTVEGGIRWIASGLDDDEFWAIRHHNDFVKNPKGYPLMRYNRKTQKWTEFPQVPAMTVAVGNVGSIYITTRDGEVMRIAYDPTTDTVAGTSTIVSPPMKQLAVSTNGERVFGLDTTGRLHVLGVHGEFLLVQAGFPISYISCNDSLLAVINARNSVVHYARIENKPGEGEYRSGLFFGIYSGYYWDDVNYFSRNRPSRTGAASRLDNIVFATAGAQRENGRDFYSIQWVGYFRPKVSGVHRFWTISDDASYLWVGPSALSGFTTRNAIVNNGGLHGMREASGTMQLEAGQYYDIRVQFGENGGGDNIAIQFQEPGGVRTGIMSGYVFHKPLEAEVAMPVFPIVKIIPSRSNQFSDFNLAKDYEISFDITPTGIEGNWGNLFRFGLLDGNCCAPGQRSPSVWFWPGSLHIHYIVGDLRDGNWPHGSGLGRTPPLTLHKKHKIVISCIGKNVTMRIDETVISMSQPSERVEGKMRVWFSDPWHPPARCIIENFNVVNKSEPPMPGKAYELGPIGMGPWGWGWGGVGNFPRHCNAKWIGKTPGAHMNDDMQMFSFYKDYTNTSQNPITARVLITADDWGTFLLNDTVVARFGPHYNGTVTLQPGLNTFEIQQQNGGGPAGLVVAVMDGNTPLFVSDKSWKVSEGPTR